MIEQARQQVEQLTLEMNRKEADIADLQTQLSCAENRSIEAQIQFNTVQRNVETLTRERDKAKARIAELEKELARSNGQISVCGHRYCPCPLFMC